MKSNEISELVVFKIDCVHGNGVFYTTNYNIYSMMESMGLSTMSHFMRTYMGKVMGKRTIPKEELIEILEKGRNIDEEMQQSLYEKGQAV